MDISKILFMIITTTLIIFSIISPANATESGLFNMITGFATQDTQESICTETDRGKDLRLKGTVSIDGTNYTDYCYSSLRIMEYYCDDTDKRNRLTTCTYGCREGACIRSEGCTDQCISGDTRCDGIKEQTCGNFDSDECTEWGDDDYCNDCSCTCGNYGKDSEEGYCSDGKDNDCDGRTDTWDDDCKTSETCIDSDGLDSTIKGRVTYNDITYTDRCHSDTYLLEFYCYNIRKAYKYYRCDNGCQDGICLGSSYNPGCEDKCISGDTRCEGDTEQICGDYDGDSCTEWGNDDDCSDCSCKCGNYGKDSEDGLCSDGKDNDCDGNIDNYDEDCSSGTDCRDSDGIDSNTKGKVTYNNVSYTDRCQSDTYLLEFYCNEDRLSHKYYRCDNGCQDGICINNPPTPQCHDECSDGQKRCNGVLEQTCGNYDADPCLEWSQEEDCTDCSCSCSGYGKDTEEGFCSDGKDNDCDGKVDSEDEDCNTQNKICEDTDNGIVYDTKGIVKEDGRQYVDYCHSYGWLVEYYCDSNDERKANTYRCPDDCKDGACISSSNCEDECTEGEKKCNGVLEQTCGDYDSDPCTEWSQEDDCTDCSCSCSRYGKDTEEGFCSDGKDNDCDGKIDSEDNDCNQDTKEMPCENYGDINEDDTITVKDLSRTIDLYNDGNYDKNADLDGDGKISMNDVNIISDFWKGTIDTFPVCNNCIETDDGRDYYNKGTLTYKGNDYVDRCNNDVYLIEFYCNGNKMSSRNHECEYGCEDGKCINKTSSCQDECTSGQTRCDGNTKQTCGDYDSDPCTEWGNDDECSDCSCSCGNYAKDSEDGFCDDGKDNDCDEKIDSNDEDCTNKICFDTDGGIIFDKKGVVKYQGNEYPDYCPPDDILVESYCNDDRLALEFHECKGICEQGKCIDDNNNSSNKTKACLDECTEGDTRCDQDSEKICGNYDDDECTEWSEENDCSDCSCNCGDYGKNSEEGYCSDGKDNDCDGKIDENDSDCTTKYSCKDTDDGLDFNNKGTVTYGDDTYEDKCYSSYVLKEAYCNENIAKTQYKICDYGCKEGECIDKTSSCEDECTIGDKRCDSTTEQTCSNYDDDPCTEWGNDDDCSDCSCSCGNYGKDTEDGLCSDNIDNDCDGKIDSDDEDCMAKDSCKDSDGGILYYKKGYLSWTTDDVSGAGYDYCSDTYDIDNAQIMREGAYLIEGYCHNDNIQNKAYKCPNGCKGGVCLEDIADNEKDSSMFDNRPLFIISDKDWRSIMSFVPVTTWTDEDGSNIEKHPMLIYHQEENADVDSTIHFVQQYEPDEVNLIGNTDRDLDNLLTIRPERGAGIDEDDIKRIDIDDYFSYWDSYKDVVYVEDDYKHALMASTYASLINAPLVIEDYSLDKDNIFSNKNTICIGDVDRVCDKTYTLEELQEEYVKKTSTDKVILVNPNDLEIRYDVRKDIENEYPDKTNYYYFKTERNYKKINNLYTRDSLASPILASAKHEVIIFTENNGLDLRCDDKERKNEYIDVDRDVKDSIENLFIKEDKPEYLTIIGSPLAIVDAIHDYKYVSRDFFYGSIDTNYYGHTFKSSNTLLNTGRIYGLSVSDVSSNIARSIFYDELFDKIYGDDLTGLAIGHSFNNYRSNMPKIKKYTEKAGYDTPCFIDESSSVCTEATKPEYSYYDKRQFFVYGDHGNYVSLHKTIGYWNIKNINMDLTYVFAHACMTNKFWSDKPFRLISTLFIRKGAISYQGATVSSGNDGYDSSETKSIKYLTSDEDMTLGKLSSNLKKEYHTYAYHYSLIGDPTLKPRFKEVEWQ